MNAYNKRRAARITKLLRHYCRYDPPETCLIDLLADARHWADLHGQDFAKLDRMAYDHYAAEVVIARQEVQS